MMIPLEPQVGEIDSAYFNLEAAIASTAEAADGKGGVTGLILQDHLKSLCALQLKRLTEEGND